MKAWPVFAIFFIQVILLLGHWLVYSTFVAFFPGLLPGFIVPLRVTVLVLAFSFVPASLLSFRLSNFVVHLFYRISAIWLGFLNLFFCASILIRFTWLVSRVTHSQANPATVRPLLAGILFALASLTGLYGLVNAQIIRTRRITVELPNLPASWRGRRAILMSDLHLGPNNGLRFCRRLVGMAACLNPDIVFIPGDLFDGTKADLDHMLAPFKNFAPPLGVLFSTGNHEEFTAATQYLEAITRAGIRVLANEAVDIDSVKIAGVFYRDSTHIIRMKAFLDSLALDRMQCCILLSHTPTRLPIVEQAGVSLQLSGHTHGGQVLPFTWLTRRVFGRFTRGLHRFGSLQVYTSTGAGTWGPPMRIGSAPEIVLFTFESSS